MWSLEQFARKKYLNLETFRKSGEGVKTPVWFVQAGGALYVKTFANSGKVKRIRNNQFVKFVPSKVDGKPVGTWISGTCRVVNDDSLEKKLDHLYDKKYGILKKMFFRSKPGKVIEYCLLELNQVENDKD